MKHKKLLKTFNRQKIIKIFTITSSGFHTPRNSKNIFFLSLISRLKKIYSYHALFIEAYIFITQKGWNILLFVLLRTLKKILVVGFEHGFGFG